ncbi:MAG: SAM-dependent chlorinase/fluorinase [Bacteroidales bacterium]|nr:SAM-dependent chlorinase/fluorinase [Bacteroidales bacterium]
MPIITLTTDWNRSDYYVGAVKGKILTENPLTQIVDISHQVQPFNILQAAFVLRNCYQQFPAGTVHIVGVNTVLSTKRKLLIIKINEQFIITADNGIVKLFTGDIPFEIYTLKKEVKEEHTLNIDPFIKTAFKIFDNDDLKSFCVPVEEYEEQISFRPVIDKDQINGSVIYIDSYANAITNISKETFEKVGNRRMYEMFIQSNHYRIDKISQSYNEVPVGELVALFNSIGLLEIAINHGNVAELLNLKVSSAVRIKFYKNKPENELKLSGG